MKFSTKPEVPKGGTVLDTMRDMGLISRDSGRALEDISKLEASYELINQARGKLESLRKSPIGWQGEAASKFYELLDGFITQIDAQIASNERAREKLNIIVNEFKRADMAGMPMA